ncbi:hypothetical protein CRI88_01990 [Lysinibacillus fusiformis]|uniref:Uncharacterized protein n=1 Tax=Lysinibacillus fusiformis TaxID=28031 RepID=A0A2I0V4A5_9BACI|nr:hypothetical protein CRI88_01990 [Lysinibacillus fusiformis]
MSEAAHRTPPGKGAGGTEINLSPCKVAFSAFDMIFFSCVLKMEWNDIGGGRLGIDFLVNKTF